MKTKVNTRSEASKYAGPGQTIVEFSHPDVIENGLAGGLISFSPDQNVLRVDLYRLEGVTVHVPVHYLSYPVIWVDTWREDFKKLTDQWQPVELFAGPYGLWDEQGLIELTVLGEKPQARLTRSGQYLKEQMK